MKIKTNMLVFLKAELNVTAGSFESGLLCGSRATGCDAPSVRDSYNPSGTIFKVRTRVAVACFNDGTCPSNVNEAAIEKMFNDLEKVYASSQVSFVIEDVNFYRDSEFAMLPPFTDSGEWFFALQQFKETYAREPSTSLNVFISGQEQGSQGTLLGIGTFPWDPDSITAQGGLWVNAAAIDGMTAAHELGHNLGNFHTFHGVSEVPCNSACFEKNHAFGAASAATVGDFVETTQATPLNYECSAPTDRVCGISKWETRSSDYKNIMSYAGDSCMSEFQIQQSARARCFLCNSLIKSQLVSSSVCQK